METKPLIFIDSSGLGDMLVAACCAAAWAAVNPNSTFVVQDHLYDWARPLRGLGNLQRKSNACLPCHNPIYLPYESYRTEMREKGKKTRHQYYGDICGIRPRLPEFSLQDCLPLKKEGLAGFQRASTAVLAPFSTQANRNWPLHRWLDLEAKLQAEGWGTVIVDNQEDRTRPFEGHRYWGQSPSSVWALIHHADLVIANDSGLAHLAGIQRKNTVVLCGPTKGECVYGFYPTALTISSDIGCESCYWGGNKFRGACNHGCESLSSLTMEMVWEIVSNELAGKEMVTA